MDSESIFLLSNGSLDSYESNTLSKFRNSFPFKKYETDRDSRYEISLDAIGLSHKFRNILLPENRSLPSIIISNMRRPKDLESYEIQFLKNEDGKDCVFQQFFPEDKYYEQDDITSFFRLINNRTDSELKPIVNIGFEDGGIVLKNNPNQPNGYFIFFHKSFIDSFGIPTKEIMKNFKSHYAKLDPEYLTNKSLHNYYGQHELSSEYESHFWQIKELNIVTTEQTYMGETYYGYYIRKPNHIVYGLRNVFQANYPSVIKVKCDNIQPQIFNGQFSKDLLCFSTSVKHEDYNYFEFVSKQFCTLNNTRLDSLAITLCDEEDNQLNLLPGVATILKLSLRKMGTFDDTFNVRLTSAVQPNSTYKNSNSSFRVRLPDVLRLNRNWKASLTSISYPNKYTTFLPSNPKELTVSFTYMLRVYGTPENDTERPLYFTQFREKYDFKIDTTTLYNAEYLVSELDSFLKKNSIGSMTIDDSSRKIQLTVTKCGTFCIGNAVLSVLGWDDLKQACAELPSEGVHWGTYGSLKVKNDNGVPCLFFDDWGSKKVSPESPYKVTFSKKPKMDYFIPKYIMIYTNFITPSIVGGKYLNLFKVIPVTDKKEEYVVKEFKHKEYYDLLYTDIPEIEIQLRSHDGEPMNFTSEQEVLVNIEFSMKKN